MTTFYICRHGETENNVTAVLRANFLDTDFGEHNISEAYPHDIVATFTMTNGRVTSFVEV
jgi:hypothetical protein